MRVVRTAASHAPHRATDHERQRMSLNRLIALANKVWHGPRLHQPDWSYHSHSVALTVELKADKLQLHLIFNAYWKPLDFELPPAGGGASWRRWLDTAQESPQDIVPWLEAPAINRPAYRAEARSVVVLYRPAA